MELECSTVHFNNIKNGIKTYEGRPNKPKYSGLKVGQKLIIKNSDNLSEYVELVITSLDVYNTFQGMLEDKGLDRVLPGEETIESGVNVYRQWYSEAVEEEFGALCIGVSTLKIHFLLVKMYETFSKLYPENILEENYIELFKYRENQFPSLLELFMQFGNILKNENSDYPYFNFRYYVGDLSFLDEYNDNVKNFFITLINDNNYTHNVFADDEELYFRLISSIDDLIQIMDCLYKNDFLLAKKCSREEFLRQCSNKNELICKNYNQESKLVKLNFVFEDSQETHYINSLFLTEDYFDKNLDEYTFTFNFLREEGFCENAINYLVTGKRSSDSRFENLISTKNINYPVEKESYFNRTICEFEDLKFVRLKNKYVLFTEDLYFIGSINELDKKELKEYIRSDKKGYGIEWDYEDSIKIVKNVELKFSKEKLKEYLEKM